MKKSKLALFALIILCMATTPTAAQSLLQKNKQPENFVPNNNVKEIIVVFKTHFNIGYTHRVKDVVQHYRTTMTDAGLESSREDKTDYIPHASTIANKLKKENLQWPAQSVKAAANSATVFNSLPWKRSGIIEMNGQPVLVKNIPAEGYSAVAISGKPVVKSSTNNFIGNQFYKIIFDANKGTVASLVDVGISLPVSRQFSKATPVNLRGEVSAKPIHIINGKFNCFIKSIWVRQFYAGISDV